MKIKQLILILFATYFLSSCVVIHNGTISSAPVGKQVQYVDIAVGVSQANKFLCFGGSSNDALILDSRQAMIRSRPLKPDEEYINYTVDLKKTFYPFWSQTKVTLCADVIKYTNDTISNIYSDNYNRKMRSQLTGNELFEIGDSIIYNNNLGGTILSFVSAEKVRILYNSNQNTIRTKILSINDIYTKKKEFKGNTVGGIYSYYITVNTDKIAITGKIIALGLHQLIIEESTGKITKLNYSN